MPFIRSFLSSRGFTAGGLMVLLSSACTDPLLAGVEYPSGSGDGGGPPLAIESLNVDVLFVIDNSPSMGEEQAALAASFGSFTDVLEGPELSHYRIGITTTDNGNPWCQGTTPEAGSLQLSSCRARLDEFVLEGTETIDASASACTDLCPEQWADIEILPSPLHDGDVPALRAWIESNEGQTNLPEGLTTEQAFQCMGPQGITGCGFESPLESMWKTLRRTWTSGDPDWGFVRDHAILSVVLVTDEADCSRHNEWDSIFLPNGNRVFWSDPDAVSPTSAVCWNAGVACEGTGTYDCNPVNLDINGEPVSDADASDLAVLHPMSRYVDILEEFESLKQQIHTEQEVLVSVIGGVGTDGSVTYQDTSSDPAFGEDFGIGPGCEGPSGQAVPPVRLRALADAMAVDDQRNMFSSCDGDYAPALEAIAEAILDQVEPSCFRACAADSEPDTPTLEPSCTITQESRREDGTFETLELPPCEGGAVPQEHDACYQVVVGDARHDLCIEIGFNLELNIVRRIGSIASPGTFYGADCDLSSDKSTDCPDLP